MSGAVYSMNEAAERLHISRRTLQEVIKAHPFYYSPGRVKLFTEGDIANLEKAMRPAGFKRTKAAPTEIRDPTQVAGFVYFIESGGFVKIGFSKKAKSRFHHIKTNSPEAALMVGVIPGTLADEKALHRRFKDLHHRGEWFRTEGALLDYLESLPNYIDEVMG